MDAVSFHHTNQEAQPKGEGDTGSSKRLLGPGETILPDPKRTKMSSADTSSDKGSHAPGSPGTPDAIQKPQKGKQNEKNKGRRRGTRPQVEDNPDRPKTPRLPKKQCAILIGFSGTNYAGMQMYVPVPPPPHDQRTYPGSVNPTSGPSKVSSSRLS